MTTTPIQWTRQDLDSLLSLPENEQSELIDSLTPEEWETLERSLSRALGTGETTSRRTEYASYEKRKESSARANRERSERGSTIHIPELTPHDRERRAELEADNEAWIWEMAGPKSGITEPLTRHFTSQQCEMIGIYNDCLTTGGDRLMLASRGEGKTTYLRAMVWKSAAEGRVSLAAFIGATGDDASNSREAIQDMIVRSEPFARYYPEIALPCRRAHVVAQNAKSMRASGVRYDDPEVRFSRAHIGFLWSQKGLRFPDVPGAPGARAMMQFRGADKPIRGLNVFGRRPDVVCIDDLDSPDTVNNQELTQKIVDRVDTDIGGLGTPTSPVGRVFLATMPKQGIGVAHHYALRGYPFVVSRFTYLIERPREWEMWMQYVRLRQKAKAAGDPHAREAHQFYVENREQMDEEAKVSNDWRFDNSILEDGSQKQISALQNYFDEWADKGEYFCRCELDNEVIETETVIESNLEDGHILNCEGDYERKTVHPTTDIVVRGVDVRKMELHFSTIASDAKRTNRIVDYDARAHGSNEITVEQAEDLIYKALHGLADEWERNHYRDLDGGAHSAQLTLIDKGWMGNWREDGEIKTWAAQPVDLFCIERGLDRYLPAKGQPAYRPPKKPDRHTLIGDNWHINYKVGLKRKSAEVVWSAEHWHRLVEDSFMLEHDDEDRFELFIGDRGLWKSHKGLIRHIKEGAADLADRQRRGSTTRKQKYRRDHWWDSLAMTLVARSIVQKLREKAAQKKPRKPLRQFAEQSR